MQSIFDTWRRAAQALQGPQAIFKDHLSKAAHRAQARVRAVAARAQARRPRTSASTPEATWMTLVRPTLLHGRTPLRRATEPVIAIVAAAALAAVGGVALANLVAFLLACLVTIAILTQIFGLSLDLDLPRPQAP